MKKITLAFAVLSAAYSHTEAEQWTLDVGVGRELGDKVLGSSMETSVVCREQLNGDIVCSNQTESDMLVSVGADVCSGKVMGNLRACAAVEHRSLMEEGGESYTAIKASLRWSWGD